MIDEIRGPLEAILNRVPEAFAATVMGFDGLPVDSIEKEAGGPDVAALVVEYSALLKQAKGSAQMFAAGELEELTIRAEKLTVVMRAVNDEYFLAAAIPPGGRNQGITRYLLRLQAPALNKALS